MRKYLLQMVWAGLVALAYLTSSEANASLVGHWTLDGNANDSSGYGNNGTVYGAIPTTGHDGQANGAFHFDGSDQILIPTSDSLKISGDMTVTAWVSAQAGPIITRYNSYQERADWAFNIPSNGVLEMGVLASGNHSDHGRWYRTSNNVVLSQNDWCHVACVYHSASDTMQFYVNGIETAAYMTWGDSVHSIHASDEPTRIGGVIGQSGNFGGFVGDIDDVRIYNTALTASEVAATVPEPSTIVLLALSGIGLMVFAGRKTNLHSIFGRTSALRFLLLFTVFGVSFLSTDRLAHGQTVYDAAAQFDLNNNPALDGFWSYGYTPTLGGSFSLLTHKYNDSRLAGWDLPDNEWPDVEKNITGHDLNYPPIGGFVPANGLTMAPGKIGTYTDGYYSALRWTAPSEGSYLIDTTFTGFWDTSTSLGDVHVLVNGVSVFDSTIFRHGSTAYKHSLELNLGDKVDFTLGRNNNTEVRSVINATITAVPEPSTIVLLALGGISVMAYARRKRRA